MKKNKDDDNYTEFIFVTEGHDIDIEKARKELFIYVLWSNDYKKLLHIQKKYKFRSAYICIWYTLHKNLSAFKKFFFHQITKIDLLFSKNEFDPKVGINRRIDV